MTHRATAIRPITPEQITGLVLCGGRGSRMGGVDKGLQVLHGQPLVWHALERLRPQVGALAINANRHAEVYAGFGVPVWPDADGDYPGPLAGMLAGLSHITTEWLLTVPCDTPRFPLDLVVRLAAGAAAAGALAAMPITPGDEPDEQEGPAHSGPRGERGAAAERSQPPSPRPPQPQPVFCLLHRSLQPALQAALAGGERKIDRFTRGQGHVQVPFFGAADAGAFVNANTAAELERLGAAR